MVAEVRDHQVVENPACVICKLCVALPPRRNRDNVLGHQSLQCDRRILDIAGLRSQRDLAHMRDVEQAGPVSRMQVLPKHAGRKLDGHLISRERNHLPAAAHMQLVQGRAL